MTSSGSSRVIPSYGPVSAAKSALEAHCRQLAYELAPRKITVNALRGGVTDTPALRKIPGNDILIDGAAAKNPSGRLTTPEDVAAAAGERSWGAWRQDRFRRAEVAILVLGERSGLTDDAISGIWFDGQRHFAGIGEGWVEVIPVEDMSFAVPTDEEIADSA